MLDRFISLFAGFVFVSVLFSVGCSAQQTEEQALDSLRQLTKDGKLPPESVVANLESRFSGKRTGALAKLLRGRIRYETGDFAGAAAILNSNDFQQKTSVADYALWLRGKALQQAGNHGEAVNVFAKLLNDFRESILVRDTKLLWAASAIATRRALEVPPFLAGLGEKNDLDAILLIGKAYEANGSRQEALKSYIRVYSYAIGMPLGNEAKARLDAMGVVIGPPDEFSHAGLYPGEEKDALSQARYLYSKDNFKRAAAVYGRIVDEWYSSMTPADHLRRLVSLAKTGRTADAQSAFAAIPGNAPEREEAYRQLVLGYAKAKLWPQARAAAEEMRQKFPNGKLTPKAYADAGYAARDAKNKGEETYFLSTALTVFPNTIEVAGAQFELAWMEHESKNYARASEMMIEHLARYADKDTTNRGKAGYWAARNAELAGKFPIACTLYETVIYRYSANWYGYLAHQRLGAMQSQGKCSITELPGNHTLFSSAIANLKTVTVAAESSGPKEHERAEKSDQLSTVGLFDWAIDELNEAKKTAQNSPKLNLALARHFRLKGNNVAAFTALRASYPDYSQMFPEEMGREEWDIFYPLTNWDQIKAWAKNRNLDQYQVAGLIRQESVFDPRAKSPAKAYGLMQLILPTAQSVARKYGSTASISVESLFLPALNIELGTGYMRDQLDKFGRIEYMAVAYNAGPGRVPQWRATLPIEIDEFVEAIPFKETKAYVQGVIRNSAQYRRLYDDNGNFKTNVGTRPLRGEIDSKTKEQIAAEFPDVVVDDRSDSE